MREVRLGHRDIRQLEPFVGLSEIERALEVAATFREWLGNRTIWNVSSTAVGGGVAEMLVPLLSYSRSLGVRIRWLVIEGSEEFFRVTKRIHHALHGSTGDGSALDSRARDIYERTTRQNATDLEFIGKDDIVLLHDPQTAGLAARLATRGALVIWRCHIGNERPRFEVEYGWRFLAPYLEPVAAYVFSRAGYVPPFCAPEKTEIIQPSIDAMSPKNQALDDGAVRAILHRVGAISGPPPTSLPAFTRTDGTLDWVRRRADIVRQGQPPAPDVPLVAQISRWDPLKDMAGVMHGFAKLVAEGRARGAHLLLAGADVKGVTDDPEGPAVFGAAAAAWRAMPRPVRERIGLCMLPTADVEENAAIVNAIQRHAAVVTQKSLHEGFGLTVTEAMWKSRPVIASAVGGLQDQIEHRKSGLLLADPLDLPTFRDYLIELLDDREGFAEHCGRAAHERVRTHFLGVRHLLQYAELIRRLESAA